MYVDGMVVNEDNRNIEFACECVCMLCMHTRTQLHVWVVSVG